MYTLTVRSIDAGQTYSHLIRVGETKLVKLKGKGTRQIF